MTVNTLSAQEIDLLENWWIEKARVNFEAYRKFMRADSFIDGWFVRDLCAQLQQFYIDLVMGKRPVLMIQSPPQMGKSIAVSDFIGWLAGRSPKQRIIFSTFSEKLGIRCNLAIQRQFDNPKYQKIFPGVKISDGKGGAIRNVSQLEFLDKNGNPTDGQFRNTTTGGPITGESLSISICDDVVKGREQANSITWSEKIWNWFTDDLSTRFSENAGMLIVMTRWTTHDLIGRLTEKYKEAGKDFKLINYQAIATKDEKHRKEGEPLFPELKSLDFLLDKKAIMPASSWDSLYQGNPTVQGGNIFKDEWWRWYRTLPALRYKFIVADTAQKTKTQNDWSVFQCWGMGMDGNIYLIDILRAKFESPDLRRQAEMFYKKHDLPKKKPDDPILRGMYIEDKSSGSGLIQELRRKQLRINEVPRHTDKIFRAEDASPYIEAGRVYLNVDIPGCDNLTSEARIFPNGEFDDNIDTLISAVEISFINQSNKNYLALAMQAD